MAKQDESHYEFIRIHILVAAAAAINMENYCEANGLFFKERRTKKPCTS